MLKLIGEVLKEDNSGSGNDTAGESAQNQLYPTWP